MSIIAYPLESTEYTAADVQTYLSTRTSGVYSEEITLTPEGMTATISPFLAWFNYAKFKGCSVAVTEPEILTFSPAHAVLDRIDRVVLRLDFTVNKAYLHVIEGVAASGTVPPNIATSEVIHDISPFSVRIRAGATEITPADITSTILDENVCGIMRDGVTGIPTNQLQAQAEEIISDLERAISEVKEGSAFMMSDVYDPEKKAKEVAFKDEVFEAAHPVGSIVTTRGLSAPPFGSWVIVPTLNNIPMKQYFQVEQANTNYSKVIDVSEYYISREDFAIVAFPKTSTPQGVSVSLGDVTFKTLTSGEEYVNTIELVVSRTSATNTWVHFLVSGTSLLGFDVRYRNKNGVISITWERVE